ncbi:MAG TPA: sigma-70 family RNA polymerase sigma factor [Gemmatimonadales bacterium]|nr:sigma-70 family RNA polymerase sigma factor [Gemmatimonadales bacterium]
MTATAPSDRELVAAVAGDGDEAAFRALYRRHTPRLWRMALRLAAGEADEAEEIVHETWVRAVPRLGTFAWRAQLSTWLASIAINCARESWRAAGALQPLEVEPPVADPVLRGADARIDLERALARLPAGYREVVVLHELEGYTHEQIAELLGIDPGTSKSQLHRARQRLRALIGPAYQPGEEDRP